MMIFQSWIMMDLRRGKPTNHKVYGDAVEGLAGDASAYHAF